MSDGSEARSVSTLELSSTTEPFKCTWQDIGSAAAWVRIVGDVDFATAPRLQATLSEALDAARVVIVDLRGVTFMDSIGIHVLMEAQHKANAKTCRLVFVRGSASLDRLFDIAGLDEQLQIVDPNQASPTANELLGATGR